MSHIYIIQDIFYFSSAGEEKKQEWMNEWMDETIQMDWCWRECRIFLLMFKGMFDLRMLMMEGKWLNCKFVEWAFVFVCSGSVSLWKSYVARLCIIYSDWLFMHIIYYFYYIIIVFVTLLILTKSQISYISWLGFTSLVEDTHFFLYDTIL